MPAQNRGESRQDYETPPDFVAAVVRMFGPLSVDLACLPPTAKASDYLTPDDDSLSVSWAEHYRGNCWLNPPFSHIPPWAKKCAKEIKKMGPHDRILFLTPASIGANWFWDHVAPNALVLPLSPRLIFVGEVHHYPKDLMLSVFGEKPGIERWKWK
jgi:phage N-6-adenine-methyltransferase